jgi:hypothetical protein
MRSVVLAGLFALNAVLAFAQTATVRVEVRSEDGVLSHCSAEGLRGRETWSVI